MEKFGSRNKSQLKEKAKMINEMCFDGKYVTVDQDIANHMNMYFCEIWGKAPRLYPGLRIWL